MSQKTLLKNTFMKQKHTFENTMVYLVDIDSLSNQICEELSLPPLIIKGFSGVVLEPKFCVIHTEIVAQNAGEDGTINIDLYKPDEKTENGRRVSMFPASSVSCTPDEIIKHLKPEPITLAEFTKDRRGYNGRLENNEYQLVNWLNKK